MSAVAPMPNAESTSPNEPATIGWVDEPRAEGIIGHDVRVSGWALAAGRIRAVEARVGAHVFRARYGLPREDVAAVRPGRPDNPNGGFELFADLSPYPPPAGVVRRTLIVVAIDDAGRETEIGRRSIIDAGAHARWQFLGERREPPFHLIPALSGIAAGGAFGLDSYYAAYASATTRIGMRVPILYLRTTTGARGGYHFDPGFDVARRHGARAVADDALAQVLAHSVAHRLPVLLTLNGGIWADASGTCPEWDLNDRLEEDVANCQWNARDEVMPDDCLSHLPGSQHAPELSRALTLNVYARAVRAYKRRNLEEAASHVVSFIREHGDLFIGVTLDPDVYVNPFFGETQWYDYNPGTLAQFRHWLAGSGPYAGDTADGVPDLTRHRRARPLSLADVSVIARRPFLRWKDVDPPRVFPRDGANAYWLDPWVREWEHFRRHLVALHYEELARWLVEAGIPRDRIWSSQGLMAPAEDGTPLALSLTSPVGKHDSGGVSIEGSKPPDGHLGAIVYGAAATNEVPMENGRSLYATLAAIDPGFAIVEFNTADLRNPARHPGYADAYRALRDLWNAGARFVSPMAWNGSRGMNAGAADYRSYTAWRYTPAEQAACDFLLDRSGLPLGSRLWTFGTHAHADDDGWTIEAGSLCALGGRLQIDADERGDATIVSPPEIALRSDAIQWVVVALSDEQALQGIVISARDATDPRWRHLADATASDIVSTRAGCAVSVTQPARFDVDRIRLTIRVAPYARLRLSRIAIVRTA